jgi:hypothetical protein
MKCVAPLLAMIAVALVGCGDGATESPASAQQSSLRRVLRQDALNQSGRLINYWQYRYDALGREIRVDNYDSNAVLRSYSQDSVDDHSRRVKVTSFDSIGRAKSSTVYHYGSDPWPLSSEALGASGSMTSKSQYTFDASGNMIVHRSFSSTDSMTSEHNFRYGSLGRDSTIGSTGQGVFKSLSKYDHSVPNQISISLFDAKRMPTGKRILHYEQKSCAQSEFYFGIW